MSERIELLEVWYFDAIGATQRIRIREPIPEQQVAPTGAQMWMRRAHEAGFIDLGNGIYIPWHRVVRVVALGQHVLKGYSRTMEGQG